MALYENLKTFAGLNVKDYKKTGDVTDLKTTAPRFRCDYEDDFGAEDLVNTFLNEPKVSDTLAIVFGAWVGDGMHETGPEDILKTLIDNASRFPNLRALFCGDIISEENEMSWIVQGDYSNLWRAFSGLEVFGVRGGQSLNLGAINHKALKSLVIETGGLDKSVLKQALAADAPLEHLEVWLGSEDYGANTSVSDLENLFDGKLFPGLNSLGLKNCEYTDQIAESLVDAPIMERVRKLDLSLGTLTNRGAKAILSSSWVGELEMLDIRHHFVSQGLINELKLANKNLIADETLEPYDYDDEPIYYIAIGE